jgi:hypothetical protein
VGLDYWIWAARLPSWDRRWRNRRNRLSLAQSQKPQSGQVQDRVTARLGQRRQLFGQSGRGGGIEFAIEKDDDTVIGTAAPRRHIAGVIRPDSAGRRMIRTALRWQQRLARRPSSDRIECATGVWSGSNKPIATLARKLTQVVARVQRSA